MNDNTIVIYHGGCRDGFCAAWVYNKYIMSNYYKGETEYFPGFYGQEPPNVKDKHVVIVDFSYDYNIMLEIISDCKSLTWLDHHKTAKQFADFLDEKQKPFEPIVDKVKYDFDNARSGAGIAWDYFFPNEPRPWLVDYVEDRDLWLNKLNNTNVVNAYVACLKFDFPVWDDANGLDVEDVAEYGQTAIMKTEQYVREVCKNVYFANIPYRDIDGILGSADKDWNGIPVVNICQVDCSEVLHELCKIYSNSCFSLYWFKRSDGMYQYGLRSIGDFDVSEVAKLFNGGGHKNAAGFQLKYLLQELQ